MKRFWLILIGFVAASPWISAGETGRPVIRSFGSVEGHSKGPVLAFAETEDGTLFLGSNHLAIFDGFRSQTIELPGAYAFRALAAAADPNRVWVGASGAFGYLERDAKGLWSFHSLAPQLGAAKIPMPAEVLLVRPVGECAVFVGPRQMLRWNGTQFQSWNLPVSGRLKAAGNRERVWALQDGRGIWEIAATGEPRRVQTADQLPKGEAQWLVPPSAPEGLEGMLVGLDSGVYRLEEGRWRRLEGVSDALAGQTGVAGADLGPDEFVVGTTENGVLLCKRDGRVVLRVDHSNGLSDDAICGLWGDRRGGVWVGLNDGCCRLDSLGYDSFFDRREGLDLGLPLKVLRAGEASYVLTDRVLYEVAPGISSSRLRIVGQASGRYRDAVVESGDIVVSGTDGLAKMPQGAVVQPGRDMGPMLALRDGVLVSVGNGLAWLPHQGAPALPLSISFREPVAQMVADSEGRIWISADGIYEVALTFEGLRPRASVRAHFAEGSGLPSDAAHPRIASVGSAVFAFTEEAVLRFDGRNAFEREPAMADRSVVAATAASGPVQYWLVQRTGLSDTAPLDVVAVQMKSGDFSIESMRVAGLDNLGEVTTMNLVEESGQPVLWIGGNGGLLRVDMGQVKPANTPRRLKMREILIEGRLSELLPLRPTHTVEISSDVKRIEFAFSAAQPMEPSTQAVFYQTRLQGVESDWSQGSHKNVREFTGLAPGRYVFMVRRLDRHGVAGETLEYAFVIAPPWYATWQAVAAYALAILGLGFVILRWRLAILRRQTERLDRLVASRTRELELSNTAKSEFLETISHEIRNPLNGIVGLAGLLKPEKLGPEEAKVARSLQASSEHLRRVAEDVLGFSRTEFGQVAVEAAPFSMKELLSGLMAAHAEQAKRQANAVQLVTPAGDNDWFVGDAKKIRTIMNNFLSNALNHAPGARIEVRADWPHEDAEECQVFLSVADGGPGVPSEEQELIFQKFVRGKAAKEEGIKGSGLGLALCRALAQRMGGGVGLESPFRELGPGPGSSFYLWLPLLRSKRPMASEAPASAGPPQALIVDDEEYNRAVLEGLCRELGYATVSAGDRAAALGHFAARPPAIVFLDLELKGADGVELARALRAMPSGSRSLLVAVTGNDSEAARARCREAGMDGFLLKPVRAEDLKAIMDKAVRGPWRAFDLYARSGAGTREQAAEHFLRSLEQETREIQLGLGFEEREKIRAAAHKLRALGALVHDETLNHAASVLEDGALTAESSELIRLCEPLLKAVDRLKSALADSGVRTGGGSGA